MATLRASARPEAADRFHTTGLRWRVALPVATALAILGTSLLIVLLVPAFSHLALGLGGSAAWLGLDEATTRQLSDATIRDLLWGGTFATPLGGAPLFTPAEVAHLRDARLLLLATLALAAGSAVVVALALSRTGTRSHAARAVTRGAVGLIVGVVLLGIVAAVAFGPAFELFHRVFFPGGNYAFDPATSRLVQLYPYGFWVAISWLLGAVLVVLAALVALAARRVDAS